MKLPSSLMAPLVPVTTACMMLLLSGCASTYYSAMEKFGVHKRDMLVENLEEYKDEQNDGKVKFEDALEEFRSVVTVDESNLESQYDDLKSALDSSEDAAEDIREKIEDVERVSEALFREWEDEIRKYDNNDLKRNSEQKLTRTKRSYDRLIDTMRESEKKLDPVLSVMRDQVLYLKHDLNARAVSSLEYTTRDIEDDIEDLIISMRASIKEANQFIREMG